MEVAACVAAVIISRGSDGSRRRWLCLTVETNLSFLLSVLLIVFLLCFVIVDGYCDVVDGSVNVVVWNVVRLC
jgi:hypothetical protein